jgi:predicted Zn-ribbon and HTH transcriptional regulator
MNEDIMKQAGFSKEVEDVKAGRCPFCKSTKLQPEDFRDELSRKEFRISGLCQKCQDDMFGG